MAPEHITPSCIQTLALYTRYNHRGEEIKAMDLYQEYDPDAVAPQSEYGDI